MNEINTTLQKPFLTRFFEEVMNQAEVPIMEFDFKKAQQQKNENKKGNDYEQKN